MFRKVDAYADNPRQGTRNTLVLTASTYDPTSGAAMGNPGNLGLPGPEQRWRCGGCGNLTRFDVVRSRRTVEFWHFDLAGDAVVEDTEVRGEAVESVTCRWCGRSDAIEVVTRHTSSDLPTAGAG